ncbi:hypothetical protein INR49_012397 [Caranx melampygus]|nr:hypothetical protein INR49_012397 [Caranx melampygus]
MVTLALWFQKTVEDVSPGCGFIRKRRHSQRDNGGDGKKEAEKEKKEKARWEVRAGRLVKLGAG